MDDLRGEGEGVGAREGEARAVLRLRDGRVPKEAGDPLRGRARGQPCVGVLEGQGGVGTAVVLLRVDVEDLLAGAGEGSTRQS